MFGFEISSQRGDEGYIEIPGLGARPGLVGRWMLERRGKPGPDGPVWTFRASLSYQNDTLLGNPDLPKSVVILMRETKYDDDTNEARGVEVKRYEVVPEDGMEVVISPGRVEIEGAHLCRLK